MTTETTPAEPHPRRRRRRAGLLSTAVVAGILGLTVPAEAAETDLPTRGTAHTGTPPVSNCTTEFVEEYKYPNEGYRVRASCTSLADWTEARGISTYPYDGHNATDWFGWSGQEYWSEWKPQMRLPVGSLHPRETKFEYRPEGAGMILYTGSGRTTSSQDHPVSVTMPSDREGTVALFWERPDRSTQLVDSATLSGGRAEMHIPSGAVDGGYQQLFAIYQGSAVHEAIRTSTTGVFVEKAVPRVEITTPYTHVPVGAGTELTVSLPHGDGPVDVVDGDRVVGSVQLRGGRGMLTTPLDGGDHVLRAVHRGDTRFLPGESAPVTLTVFEPRIEVESATLQPGDQLRATATLPAEAVGRVQFLLTWSGNMAGIGAVEVVDGKASFSIPVDRIGAGTFGLAADHRGGNGLMPSRSAPVTITIGGVGASAAQTTTEAEATGEVDEDSPDGDVATESRTEDG